MTADTLVADLLVLALSNAWLLLLAVPAFALGTALTWWRQQRRSAPAVHVAAALSIRVADLELAVASERLTAALERDNAAAATACAIRAHAHACSLAQDVVALQHQLQQVAERVALAQLEASTEWERP